MHSKCAVGCTSLNVRRHRLQLRVNDGQTGTVDHDDRRRSESPRKSTTTPEAGGIVETAFPTRQGVPFSVEFQAVPDVGAQIVETQQDGLAGRRGEDRIDKPVPTSGGGAGAAGGAMVCIF